MTATLMAPRNTRRREIHAVKARTFSPDEARRLLLGYHNHRMGAVHKTAFRFKPGFIYTQVRAISARINQNYDGWPSADLKKSYRTFIGKPIFVNHQNFDPKKARGKVVAARYIENGNDKYVETVMEIDAQRFPKLASEIITGGMDSVSMGVEAGFTICSYCGNKAVDTPEFCAHVKYHKGQHLPRRNDRTGATEDVLVYEKCHKLSFFELSYVFDPADETAVVSRVISAAAEPPPPDEIWVPEMASPNMPTASRRRHGYGEIEAPEDVDTLRGEDEDDDTDEFKHFVESPKELKGPDLDQTKRLDREQEQQGLDHNRRVEQVEDIGGPQMPNRQARRARRRNSGASVLVDPRTGRRYYAADEDPQDEEGGGPPPDFGGGEDPSADPMGGGGDEGGFPPEEGDDEGGEGGPPQSDEDLIQEAEQDLDMAEQAGAGIDPSNPGSNAGGTDDDYADQDDDEFGGGDDEGLDDLLGGGDEGGEEDPFNAPPGGPDGGLDDGGDEDLPPWLQNVHGGGGGDDMPPPAPHEARRNGNRARSNRNSRTGGSPMGLSQRGRVATAGRRRHYADESGHTDGGPYHVDDNDQGEQEDIFISQTPGSEALAAPVPGDGTISNTENNLVASLSRRIQQRNAQQQRDIIAWEQITGQKVGSQAANRRYADAVERPDQVNPSVQTGPGGNELTGNDFESLGEEPTETQPKDASVHAFAAFNNWLRQTTGRTASQHNRTFIRRQAARWCAASGLAPEALFPTLGNVLREAQRNEGSTNRRSNMQRRADEKLEVAAPQDRIDVEAPVRDTTDADAQASQFNLGEFGDNAGDNLADPDLSVNTQIWAPGEGDSSTRKDSNRKADGITAVRYAEAYITAGLGTPDDKYRIAGLAQTMRHGTIVDRTALLDEVNKVNQQRFAALRRTANLGAARGLPQGMGGRQMTAGTQHQAANPIADDSALFLK